MPPLYGSFITWLHTTDLPSTMPGHRFFGEFREHCTRAGKPRLTNVAEILALAHAAGLRVDMRHQGRRTMSRIFTERNS